MVVGESLKSEYNLVIKKIHQIESQINKLQSEKRIADQYGKKKDVKENDQKIHDLQYQKKELLSLKEKLEKEIKKSEK